MSDYTQWSEALEQPTLYNLKQKKSIQEVKLGFYNSYIFLVRLLKDAHISTSVVPTTVRTNLQVNKQQQILPQHLVFAESTNVEIEINRNQKQKHKDRKKKKKKHKEFAYTRSKCGILSHLLLRLQTVRHRMTLLQTSFIIPLDRNNTVEPDCGSSPLCKQSNLTNKNQLLCEYMNVRTFLNVFL